MCTHRCVKHIRAATTVSSVSWHLLINATYFCGYTRAYTDRCVSINIEQIASELHVQRCRVLIDNLGICLIDLCTSLEHELLVSVTTNKADQLCKHPTRLTLTHRDRSRSRTIFHLSLDQRNLIGRTPRARAQRSRRKKKRYWHDGIVCICA